jgi:hypothetical protein
MTTPSPQQSLTQGFKLGLVLLFVFFISATLVWLALGALGSSGTSRLLIALFTGPIVGSGGFWVWWRFPIKTLPATDETTVADEKGESAQG